MAYQHEIRRSDLLRFAFVTVCNFSMQSCCRVLEYCHFLPLRKASGEGYYFQMPLTKALKIQISVEVENFSKIQLKTQIYHFSICLNLYLS